MTGHYILDGHQPIPTDDLLTWAAWFSTADRRVAHTTIDTGEEVSTVFLGVDHRFGSGPPLLFETLVFGGPATDECWRYSTWEEAEAGHARMVAVVMAK